MLGKWYWHSWIQACWASAIMAFRIELSEFELVESEVELVPHDDIVLVIGVPSDVY